MAKNTDWNALFDAALETGKAILPLVVPGAAPALAAAEKVIEMLDHLRDEAPEGVSTATLEQGRDDFERAVNAQVENTIDRLRGG